MALYTQSARTSATTAAAAWELRTASTDRVKIREIGAFVAGVAGAYNFALGRPAAIGVTPTANTAIVPVAQDPAEAASTVTMAIAWATPPTAPTNAVYLRRCNLPATLGAGIIWTWPSDAPLVVPVSSSLVLFLLTAPTASSFLDVYAVWDE